MCEWLTILIIDGVKEGKTKAKKGSTGNWKLKTKNSRGFAWIGHINHEKFIIRIQNKHE